MSKKKESAMDINLDEIMKSLGKRKVEEKSKPKKSKPKDVKPRKRNRKKLYPTKIIFAITEEDKEKILDIVGKKDMELSEYMRHLVKSAIFYERGDQ